MGGIKTCPELISSKQALRNKCLILRPGCISGKTNRPLYLRRRMRLQSPGRTRRIISWSTLENKSTKAPLIHEKARVAWSAANFMGCGIVLSISWLVSVRFLIFLTRGGAPLAGRGQDVLSSVIGTGLPQLVAFKFKDRVCSGQLKKKVLMFDL